MKAFLERRRYRKSVYVDLRYILLGFPRDFVSRIQREYPGISAGADQGFAAGEDPAGPATRIAAHILTDIIEHHMLSDTRDAVRDALIAKARGAYDPASHDPNVNSWVTGILVADSQASMLGIRGAIGDTWGDLMSSEISGALRGISSDVRQAERLARALEQLTKNADTTP